MTTLIDFMFMILDVLMKNMKITILQIIHVSVEKDMLVVIYEN